jgi:hypothetical protein
MIDWFTSRRVPPMVLQKQAHCLVGDKNEVGDPSRPLWALQCKHGTAALAGNSVWEVRANLSIDSASDSTGAVGESP